jgi:predicted aspartyl protease
MMGLTPLVTARINGVEARLILDSGAAFSEISMASAEQFNLALSRDPLAFIQRGITGSETRVLRAERFELGIKNFPDVKDFSNVEVVATQSKFRDGAVGLVGQNVLGSNDVEYDLANGVVRLSSPKGECKDANLAYWADSMPLAVVDLHDSRRREHTFAEATVNGKTLRVSLDTGSPFSLMSFDAAKRAGLLRGAVSVASDESGLGSTASNTFKTWLAPMKSFALGTEEIRNERVRFSETALDDENDVDMLLGADFILAHHIYLAKSQGRLYLTHNGGPVFERPAGSVLDAPGTRNRDSTDSQVDWPTSYGPE